MAPPWTLDLGGATLDAVQVLPAETFRGGKREFGAHLADFGADGSRTENSKGKLGDLLVTFDPSVILSSILASLFSHIFSLSINL